MRIAVNARFLLSDYLEGFGHFTHEIFRRITLAHPDDEFIFIFDRPFDKRFLFAPNIISVVVGPAARHPLIWKYWYDVRLPAVLKKYHADVFVSSDGFCSLRTRVPQCLIVHDLAFLHYPSLIRRSHLFFMKTYLPRFVRKATSIVTVSEFSKNDIIQQYKVSEQKVRVVSNAARQIFQPISQEQATRVKEKYSNGKEFFLYAGAIHPRKNLVTLLKAFSIFKKRQKSSLKLVLAGRLAWQYESFLTSLRSYKYREDVILTGYLAEDELAVVMASAYALVYVSLFEGFGVPVLEAMKCRVPVITSGNSAMAEIAGDAALYAEPANSEEIAERMMRLYKDEKLRAELIVRGEARQKQYSWEHCADSLWRVIRETAS